MNIRFAILGVSLVVLSAASAPAQNAACSALASKSFGAEIRIESAVMVRASPQAPEHCDVRGVIAPEARFAVKLPVNWNNRFYLVGGGGYAGSISHGPMNIGLQKGYATASTDTGHDAAKEPLATFANPGPNNPHADRKVLDYAYLAVHNTAVLAKQIIAAYYGSAPRYSYWVGCSTGGRQGLMEAQRYPEDFDGYVIGAPVLKISHEQLRGIWNAQAVTSEPGRIAVEKLPLLAAAIYRKCDEVDGVKDGLIADPRRCGFDPAADLPKCAGDADGKDCFTLGQIAGLKKVYGGVRTSAGKLLYPGQPVGAEIAPPGGRSAWIGSIGAEPGGGLAYGETFMRFMIRPPMGADWSYKTFNFDTDPARLADISKMIDATNPDLKKIKKRGGKIIHYHGWADALVNPLMSVEYYESVLKKMGEKQTKEFYKLYLVPGMFHCRGGVGCDDADWFTPLVAWVEKGVAPGALNGSRVVNAATVMTRPHCAYPEVATYKGSGDPRKAENFSCVRPKAR
ncbi:MAG: tannase/feruloyl esterase family alpha/beta hydrolase [Blastocatellia bacterium]|nr:tannase/feruloyl esterase family alpha/beta hydrolase [Blastocatellia bacterium]